MDTTADRTVRAQRHSDRALSRWPTSAHATVGGESIVGRSPGSRTSTSCATVATWVPSLGEHVAERETPATDEVEAGEVVQMPPIGPQSAVEPDRVVEAGAEHRLARRLVAPRRDGRGRRSRSADRRTGRPASSGGAAVTVASSGSPSSAFTLHPGDDSSVPLATSAGHPFGRDVGAAERHRSTSPRRVRPAPAPRASRRSARAPPARAAGTSSRR